ncbi:hypothetical protein HJG54_31545 [Leptolyngbya sp. NK1-12]|uniref:Mobilization protein MobC n=2 Tax=unclassified Leptolyngbya TaxID=2650499 RepID=A0AA96WL10_9CYAN|nr:hypothetical protein [Leptolyngbya sp. NK1-12]MBF2046978.1 hypothetical protein [Elainella sp. C42_A2020_010]WNZ27418.1 hypothetical protein HJG54_31545 [Leptolyngbya sp. NK1-12]
MISTTRRSPNATLVTKASIDQASEALQSLPEKTKEKLSLREAVDVLRDHITAALDKGYSYEDIAAMLAKQGVSIAPSSLKHYLARSNRQLKAKGAGTQTRRRRSSKAAEALEPEEDQELPDLVTAASTEAAPKRGRRSAAKASAPEPKTTRSTASRTKSVAAAPTRKRRGKASS